MAILRALSRMFAQPESQPGKGPKTPYKTDKVENALTTEYETVFRHLLERPVSILEVGLYRGDSLRFWDDLFTHPQSRIVGIDRRIPVVRGSDRIVTRECDQN